MYFRSSFPCDVMQSTRSQGTNQVHWRSQLNCHMKESCQRRFSPFERILFGVGRHCLGPFGEPVIDGCSLNDSLFPVKKRRDTSAARRTASDDTRPFLLRATHRRVSSLQSLPPHVGSVGLFCPRNAAQICSSSNQMAAFTVRSVTPVPHHMTFASLGAVSLPLHPRAPPVLRCCCCEPSHRRTTDFIFSRSDSVSSDCCRAGGENAASGERFGWSRAGPLFLVPGANLFTVKFGTTRHARTCDWTEATLTDRRDGHTAVHAPTS